MSALFDIIKILKWVLIGGFILGGFSIILVFLPDPNLNNLGEGLKTLAQVISDLPHMLSIFVYFLIAIFLIVVIIKILGRD